MCYVYVCMCVRRMCACAVRSIRPSKFSLASECAEFSITVAARSLLWLDLQCQFPRCALFSHNRFCCFPIALHLVSAATFLFHSFDAPLTSLDRISRLPSSLFQEMDRRPSTVAEKGVKRKCVRVCARICMMYFINMCIVY